MVALTFDDGPQPSVGNRIMDCLAQYGGKATFFMVGERVGSHKAEVQRMVAEGHEVANHSMNHKYFQKLGAAEIRSQVEQCNDAIEAACGVRPKLMRLPGGNVNSTVKANVNMPMIQWNIDTLDWKTKNADKTVAAVLDHVKDGDIILMHELYSQSGDAALRIIPELHRRGYQMVTVSEMAAAKGYSLEAGKLYSSFR
ncbi:MAG TPA: polysaccharide deacetylase family protein [Candidatus Ventrimonas merdavium]|nr:polysaccharide deacetylase family protein [Candidatus Ventrimonas merdavium]